MAKKPKTAYEKIRKPTAPQTIWHKDDTDYDRKKKHPKRDVTRSFHKEDDDENVFKLIKKVYQYPFKKVTFHFFLWFL